MQRIFVFLLSSSSPPRLPRTNARRGCPRDRIRRDRHGPPRWPHAVRRLYSTALPGEYLPRPDRDARRPRRDAGPVRPTTGDWSFSATKARPARAHRPAPAHQQRRSPACRGAFRHGIGSTAGDFHSPSTASASAPRAARHLRFGDTVANSIPTPAEVYYSFRAAAALIRWHAPRCRKPRSAAAGCRCQPTHPDRDRRHRKQRRRPDRALARPRRREYRIVATPMTAAAPLCSRSTACRRPRSANSPDSAIRLFDARPDEREITAERNRSGISSRRAPTISSRSTLTARAATSTRSSSCSTRT